MRRLAVLLAAVGMVAATATPALAAAETTTGVCNPGTPWSLCQTLYTPASWSFSCGPTSEQARLKTRVKSYGGDIFVENRWAAMWYDYDAGDPDAWNYNSGVKLVVKNKWKTLSIAYAQSGFGIDYANGSFTFLTIPSSVTKVEIKLSMVCVPARY